jgi:DNA-binding winged helix-turn-helix (wHTH) protein
MPNSRRLCFDRYVLDLSRGYLLLDSNEIALRPQTFAVPHHLVENAGHLISKDELFPAVWPNTDITHDALVRSMGELRRAVGEDGVRLIKPIRRPGFPLDADVSTADANSSQPTVARIVRRYLRLLHYRARASVTAGPLLSGRM